MYRKLGWSRPSAVILILALILVAIIGVAVGLSTAQGRLSGADCTPVVTGDQAGEASTTHAMAYDDDTATFFNSSYDNWQYIQVDFNCVGFFSALRRYMSRDGTDTSGHRSLQGEGVSYSLDGVNWTDLTGDTTNGWEDYVNYVPHAWHSVMYGWSAWLNVNSPVQARHVRFRWDDNFDAINEIELIFRPQSACQEDVGGKPNMVDVGDIMMAVSSLGGEPRVPQQDLDGDGVITMWDVESIAAAWHGLCDARQLAWAQDYPNGNRRILLRWNPSGGSSGPEDSFTIFRRVADSGDWSGDWTEYDTTAFAADAQVMADILGQDLLDQLALDLRDPPKDPGQEVPPLTEQEVYDALLANFAWATLLADRYYQVALAIGAAYLDLAVPANEVMEYYVARTGAAWPRFGPVSIVPNAAIPAPTNLRESSVFDGPPGLGERPSWRLFNVEERYNWDAFQSDARADGRVFLIWDLPPGDGDWPNYPAIAGYNVYRRRWGWEGSEWELTNPPATNGVGNQLIRPGHPGDGEDCDDDAFFQDDLKTIFADSDPNDIYRKWDYKACPVDLLSNEGTCSSVITVPVRELGSPEPITDLHLEVMVEPNGHITVTWNYTDDLEISLPLLFFVTRSPTATLPITSWTELEPLGIPYPVASPTFTLTFTDTPPVGTSFWYRVQVRDNAGNWSPPGRMDLAGLFPREAPDLDPIPYDDVNCANNSPAINLTGLDPSFRQIVIYRAFDQAAPLPWHLIKRVLVEDNSATFLDSYIPPFATIVYYRLEGVDGHGNTSNQIEYCTVLDPGHPPRNPTITVTDVVTDVETGIVEYTLTFDDGGDGTPGVDGHEVTITQPQSGAEGNITTTTTITNGQALVGVPPGATLMVKVQSTNANGESEGTVVWLRNVNDFLDTNRHMTGIKSLFAVEWASGPSNPEVYIHIEALFPDQWEFAPWVAVFRQILDGGSWMQVTPVQALDNSSWFDDPRRGPVATWVVADTADLSVNETYNYTALAFSPTSFEVLGYWGTVELGPRVTPTPDYIKLTYPLRPPPSFPDNCIFEGPEYLPQILLHNGWTINVDSLVVECNDSGWDPNGIYGTGFLTPWFEEELPIEFVNIAVDGAGRLTSGRIMLDLDDENLNLDFATSELDRFKTHFLGFEFLPNEANVELILNLPITVVDPTAVDPQASRNRRVFGVFADLGTDLSFQPLLVNTPGQRCDNADPALHLLDENLPWRLHSDSMAFGPGSISLGGKVCTSDRLGYTPPVIGSPADPDNNLGFMRERYTSINAIVTKDGLQGSFATVNAISYVTSLPAGAVVSASGASVDIDASQIVSGALTNAGLRLEYFKAGTDTTYVRASGELVSGYRPNPDPDEDDVIPGSEVCEPDIYVQDDILRVERNGVLLADLGLSGNLQSCLFAVSWPGFFVAPPFLADVEGTFFAAAAVFEDKNTTPAPMPAENAWSRLPEPITGGDLDPGININRRGGSVWYSAYPDASFDDVDMDLYVRRGGVSENLIINPDGIARENYLHYQVTILNFDAVFLDNAILEADIQTELFLPYPSDVVLPLNETEWEGENRPLAGDIIGPVDPFLHKYWEFEQTPSTWWYEPYNDGKDPRQKKILALRGTAVITGLGPKATSLAETDDFVTVPIISQWFPNGDYGDIEVTGSGSASGQLDYYRVSGVPYALTDVKLSRYYSTLMKISSLPDTLGLELDDTLLELPDELLDAEGKLTPESLKACSTTGDGVGCGFVVLDGNGCVEYFGGVERYKDGAARATSVSQFLGDEPLGAFPIAINSKLGQLTQAVIEELSLRWSWPVVNDLVDFDIPVKFLGNSAGGALVGVLAGQNLEVIETDIAAIVTIHFDERPDINSFGSEFGIFVGGTASQAAFRALAMHRPREDGDPGVKAFDDWDDVKDDVTVWATKFGYTLTLGLYDPDDDDVVDLAEDIWTGWGENSFDKAFDILEPIFMPSDVQDPVYGLTSFSSGQILENAGVSVEKGLGQAIFFASGDSFNVKSLRFGMQFAVNLGEKEPDELALLQVDWINLNYNRDAEWIIRLDNAKSFLLGDVTEIDGIVLIGTKEGFERVEGGVTINQYTISAGIFDFEFRDVAAVLGGGKFDGRKFQYFGFQGVAHVTVAGSRFVLGGAVLFGIIDPGSPVLREAGFGNLMDKFGAHPGDVNRLTYEGAYVAVMGGFPLISYSCLAELSVGAEVRVWHFTPSDGSDSVWGGKIQGSVYGTVACIFSGRGTVALTIEEVAPEGFSEGHRECTKPKSEGENCFAATGQAWAAVGIGFCDPEYWYTWEGRWWDDSWCWTCGAEVLVTYIKPGGFELGVDFGCESPF